MINKNEFQKAAKDFRAGRIVLKDFTDLVFNSLQVNTPNQSGPPTQVAIDSNEPMVNPPPADLAGTNLTSSEVASIQVASVNVSPTVAPQDASKSAVQPSRKSSPAHSTKNLLNAAATPSRLNIDEDRANRCGWPEVIYGPGKTLDDLKQAARKLLSRAQNVLITRISEEFAKPLLEAFPSAIWNGAAKTFRILGRGQASVNPPDQNSLGTASLVKIAILTAGTGDISIAEEAAETLKWMGQQPTSIYDVGVAGPARLQRHIDFLQTCDVIVVVAGMEGALPSVVGGYVSCPVIAVPTSIGYGASFQGLAPLLGMLNSCAANVTTVNIDGGFKAGYLAGLIAGQIQEARR